MASSVICKKNSVLSYVQNNITIGANTHGGFTIPYTDITSSAKPLSVVFEHYSYAQQLSTSFNISRASSGWVISIYNPTSEAFTDNIQVNFIN